MNDGRADETGFLSAFARIGLYSFGGPAAQIALMHRVLVEETRWFSEERFLKALSFCMLLPGPEAMQLATYAGWRLRGVAGGLVAGLLFVVPGALVIFALAALYVRFGAVPLVDAAFLGVKAAVLAIVVQAVLRLVGKALRARWHVGLAVAAFAALFVLDLPFPLVIVAAATVGWWCSRNEAPGGEAAVVDASLGRTALTFGVGLMVWLVPLWLVSTVSGAPVIAEVATFFSMLAALTFGGAYAVLAWMAQTVVADFGWLTAGQMLDALGLAETTPGPLILVTQFVAFLGGHGAGGMGLAFLAGLTALWATFVPCFVWIFAGAPWVETLTARPRLQGALAGVSAAVVGVIASLSVWFALHVFFGEVARAGFGPLAVWWPQTATPDWRAVLLAALAAALLLGRGWGMLPVLALNAAVGLALAFV